MYSLICFPSSDVFFKNLCLENAICWILLKNKKSTLHTNNKKKMNNQLILLIQFSLQEAQGSGKSRESFVDEGRKAPKEAMMGKFYVPRGSETQLELMGSEGQPKGLKTNQRGLRTSQRGPSASKMGLRINQGQTSQHTLFFFNKNHIFLAQAERS